MVSKRRALLPKQLKRIIPVEWKDARDSRLVIAYYLSTSWKDFVFHESGCVPVLLAYFRSTSWTDFRWYTCNMPSVIHAGFMECQTFLINDAFFKAFEYFLATSSLILSQQGVKPPLGYNTATTGDPYPKDVFKNLFMSFDSVVLAELLFHITINEHIKKIMVECMDEKDKLED